MKTINTQTNVTQTKTTRTNTTATDRDIAVETAKLLLSINAMSFRFDPPFTYTSGLKSPVYLDNRLVLSHPDVRSQIIKLYIQAIEKHVGRENVQCVSGTATAAIPQAAWIADHMGVPMVYARSSAKAHGKKQKIEGQLTKGSKVIIIEDHISTGGSAIDNAKTIREVGGIVEFCVATTTYETEASRRAFAENNIQLITLTTGKIIVEQAEKMGLITPKQAASVHAWFENPSGW